MKRLCLILGLTLSVALAACGGGSSDSASISEGGLSKSEWIARADAICQSYRDETEALSDEIEALEISASSPRRDLVAGARLFRQLYAKAKDESDALRELAAPQGEAGPIDAMLSKIEETRDLGLQAADALGDGDTAEAEAILDEGSSANAAAREMARGYGLKVCG